MDASCLCIDVGGSSIKYALMDDSKKLQKYGKIPTPYDGVEAYIQCLIRTCLKTKGPQLLRV